MILYPNSNMAENTTDKSEKKSGYYPKFEAIGIEKLDRTKEIFGQNMSKIFNQTNIISTHFAEYIKTIQPITGIFQEFAKNVNASFSLNLLEGVNNIGTNILGMLPDIKQITKSTDILSKIDVSTPPLVSIFEDAVQSTRIFPELSELETPKHKTEEIINLDQLEDELDNLIAKVNPEYIKLRTGAWQALESDNVDKVRQASVSMRELVKKILKDILPSGKTRRDGLKEVLPNLKENELKFIDNTIAIILCLDEGVHKVESLNEKFANYLLSISEKTLWLILENKK